MATTGNTLATVQPVNLNPQAEDCYFYFYSKCSKGDRCKFRHCSAALGSESVCELWDGGGCTRKICAFRHSVAQRQRSHIPCFWENQAVGCLKPHCPFKHTKPRPELPGTVDRLTQYKQTAFDTLKVKSLNEIHQEKLHPTLTHGYQHRTYVPAKKPMSFELRSVLQVSGVKVHPNSNAGGSNDAQQMLPAKPATAVMRTKTIFAGSQDMSSIFSPEYKGSDSKDSIETVPHVRTKQESLTVPSSDKEAQSGRYSKRSTPAGAQENSAPADQPTSASADQGIPKSGQPGGIITSHMGEKRPQVAMETKREQPVAKKPKVSLVKAPSVASEGLGFRVKTLDEIRAEKRKRKEEEGQVDKETQDEGDFSIPTSSAPAKSPQLPTSSAPKKSAQLPTSSAPTKSALLPTATSTAGAQPCSRTDDEDQPQPTRKKIVLMRKKSQPQTSVPVSVTEPGQGQSLEAVAEKVPLEAISGGSGEASMVHYDTTVQVRRTVEGAPEVKRMKLSRPSKEGAVVSKTSGSASSGLNERTHCEPPPNVDTMCIESSVPLEEREKTSAQEGRVKTSGQEGSVKTSGQGTSGQGYSLSEMTVEDGSQDLGSKHVDKETGHVRPLELPAGLSERKESIDSELEGLLSPAVEEGKEEGRRVVGSKRQSIAEMKAEIRSELKRQESELHGETLDAELELFEQELMEGGDVMLDSRTDDDLMLEMEEFL